MIPAAAAPMATTKAMIPSGKSLGRLAFWDVRGSTSAIFAEDNSCVI
jgi:hypothetical protein